MCVLAASSDRHRSLSHFLFHRALQPKSVHFAVLAPLQLGVLVLLARAPGRAIGWLAALLVLAPNARAETDLPFTPAFAERVEETFFEAGSVSPDKVERYRRGLAQRRDEVYHLFVADERADGHGKKKARSSATKRW